MRMYGETDTVRGGVGVLTNLNHFDLERTLGVRVMDRLTMDGGMWVNFDWESYRWNVSYLSR